MPPGRPGRVADLQVRRIEDTRLCEDHVSHEPDVKEAEVADRDAEQFADGAAGPVAADNVPCPHLAVCCGSHGHVLGRLHQAGNFCAAADLDARQGTCAPVQQVL
jgi:hypothetical protein